MRQFLFGALLLGSATVVQAINDFEPVFSSTTKGDDEEAKWINFSTTDLKSITLVNSGTKATTGLPRKLSRSPLCLTSAIITNRFQVTDCAESGKTQSTCTRFVNDGKYKLDGDDSSRFLTAGSSYYFELEYIQKAPSVITGKSKSTTFSVQEKSTSSSSSSSSKSKKKGKKGKGKLGAGGIIGIAVGIAVFFLILAFYGVKSLIAKRKNKNSTSKDLETHELGKQEDPLMGQDGRVASTTAWSADVPEDHTKPQEPVLSKYEPYQPKTTGQGAAAEYYNEPSKPSGNGAGPMGNDRY